AIVAMLTRRPRTHRAVRSLHPLTPRLARISPWAWRWHTAGGLNYPYYLSGLLLIALLLVLLRAALAFVMREAAARASAEAATRLRRAVYHHTFRLGTLAFRALGPSEAVPIFTRHVDAIHQALYPRP